MKLYYTKGACSLAVRIVINEIGVPCEYESVDLKSKQTETGNNFLTINPKGAVPALETNEGEILTENAVIQQYLADKFHATTLLPPISDFKRYQILEMINYVSTELHKTIGWLFNPLATDEMKEKIIKPTIKHKLTFVNKNLHTRFLVGDEFTLPDAYFFVMLTWLKNFKFDLAEWPKIQEFFIENCQRPSILKSLQEEKLVLEKSA